MEKEIFKVEGIEIEIEKYHGEAKDIRHGFPGIGTADLYAGDYSDCEDCDLIIITAGRGRKIGESRLDLANENVKIMRNVIDSIQEASGMMVGTMPVL